MKQRYGRTQLAPLAGPGVIACPRKAPKLEEIAL